MLQRSVCVFCGSGASVDPRFFDLARAVGEAIVSRGMRLVYGGASVGLMGAVADAALRAGGRVLGVIPHAIEAREIAHRGVTELRVVPTMHVRKQTMADESDAFVALPGGFGTMDELFEIATWRQLGLHDKPIALFDAHGYYGALREWFARAHEERFVASNVLAMVDVVESTEAFAKWLGDVAVRVHKPAPAGASEVR